MDSSSGNPPPFLIPFGKKMNKVILENLGKKLKFIKVFFGVKIKLVYSLVKVGKISYCNEGKLTWEEEVYEIIV